jgi:hypothetical protein
MRLLKVALVGIVIMGETGWQAIGQDDIKKALIENLIGDLGLDQAKPARLGEARNQKNSKSLVFLRRLMK